METSDLDIGSSVVYFFELRDLVEDGYMETAILRF